MLNSEFMNNDMEQVDQCGVFFAYIAAWDTSYIPDGVGHGWICQTSIELVGVDCRLEMRCISCFGVAFYRDTSMIFVALVAFSRQPVSTYLKLEVFCTVETYNISKCLWDIRHRKWCLVPSLGILMCDLTIDREIDL